ncbi:hypothetical protein OA670_03675 [Candidatus Pelagibacter sp.]|nr:hypothetical protein [Candidatus Pelagibacter sp.]
MSYLIKENKNLIKSIKITILIILLLMSILGYLSYIGNKFYYIFFTLVSNYLIYFAFRKKVFFFETFFSILLWLGFWFKFTVTISLTDGIFKEGVGDFSYRPEDFDQVIFVSTIGILGFLISGYVRQIFLFNYNIFEINNIFKSNFYEKNRIKILYSFLFIIIFIVFLNTYFKVYQRGLISTSEINFIFEGTIKWLLLFGLASISSIILYFEIINSKKISIITIIIVLFESFLSSMSMLSRGMIFNSSSILYGIYKFSKKYRDKLNIKKFLSYVIIMLSLFYISTITVNFLRVNYFYVGKSFINVDKDIRNLEELKEKKEKFLTEKKKINLIKSNSEIYYLMINRWVGIDPIMAMIDKRDKLSFKLLKKSFSERFNKNTPTFYEKTFNLENDTNFKIYENVKGNTLMGIIGFLYYSGSLYFLFISIIFLSIIACFFEYLAFKLSFNNLIFSSLISQIIAFRYIHFGYLPHQTYLLFVTIILNILIVYILMKAFKYLVARNFI